jgi:hypothetical protein
MELVLTFPDLVTTQAKVSEILAQMETYWNALSSMPAMNAAYILTESLATFNRLPMRFDERANCLERYHQTAQQIWDQLERLFVLAPQPLRGEARQASEIALRMCQEIAFGYKRLLHDTLSSAGNKLPETLVLSLILRIQQVSGRILVVSVLSYQTMPVGLWSDLHQCFAFTMHHQLQNRPIQPDKPGYTIAYSYAQLVLLGLANPYSFRPEQWPILNEYIARFSVFLELFPDSAESPGMLKIPIMQDYPPRFPLQSNASAPITLLPGEQCIGLNLEAVVNHLAQAQEQLNNPEGPYSECSPIERIQRQHLLEHLNRTWRGDWVRRHTRTPVAGEVELVVGLRFVADRLFNREAPFKKNAVLLNHTSSGYAFSTTTDEPLSISVGEVVYICFENDTPLLGSVRWIRSPILGERSEFGIHLMEGIPTPIKLRPAFEQRKIAASVRKSPPFQWSIQLKSEEEDESDTTRFVLASGLCQTGQLLLAQDTLTSELSLWKCAECLEQTAVLSIFRFISAKPTQTTSSIAKN